MGPTPKTQRRKRWALAVAVLVAAAAGWPLFRDDVVVSDLEWDCRRLKDSRVVCDVSFAVENRSRNPVDCRLTLRGFRAGARGGRLGFVGDKIVVVELQPRQVLRAAEKLSLPSRPSHINVTVWN
jgi:hypothetical protein